MTPDPRFEVIYGSHAVWINDATGCLGRFGAAGIDLHNTKAAGAKECLFCTHEAVKLSDWPRFVDAMIKFHGIDIRDQPVPRWLSETRGRKYL